MKFNEQVQDALRALADFVISDGGYSAVATGEMKVEVTRAVDNALCLKVEFSGGDRLRNNAL